MSGRADCLVLRFVEPKTEASRPGGITTRRVSGERLRAAQDFAMLPPYPRAPLLENCVRMLLS